MSRKNEFENPNPNLQSGLLQLYSTITTCVTTRRSAYMMTIP